MYLRSRLYRELGRDDDALAALDEIIGLSGEGASRPDVYFDKGDIYVSRPQPDYAGAVSAYEEGLIRIEPRERIEYPDVFYNLGCSYARLGDGEKALECLKAAFDAEPRFARDARDDDDLVSMQGNSDFEKSVARAEEMELELEAENTSIPLGDPAPDFTLADIQGGKFSLSHFRGKPVVLNIWATWCPPCRREIPDLVDFAEEHRGEVVVLSVSVDEPGTDLASFAEEFKINYPVLLNADGAAESYLTVNQGIPQTYFIDEDGKVRGHILGSASRDVFESRLRRFVPAESE
jgi:peroxiredoxin